MHIGDAPMLCVHVYVQVHVIHPTIRTFVKPKKIKSLPLGEILKFTLDSYDDPFGGRNQPPNRYGNTHILEIRFHASWNRFTSGETSVQLISNSCLGFLGMYCRTWNHVIVWIYPPPTMRQSQDFVICLGSRLLWTIQIQPLPIWVFPKIGVPQMDGL